MVKYENNLPKKKPTAGMIVSIIARISTRAIGIPIKSKSIICTWFSMALSMYALNIYQKASKSYRRINGRNNRKRTKETDAIIIIFPFVLLESFFLFIGHPSPLCYVYHFITTQIKNQSRVGLIFCAYAIFQGIQHYMTPPREFLTAFIDLLLYYTIIWVSCQDKSKIVYTCNFKIFSPKALTRNSNDGII